ncbi:MAG TPA: TIGR01777 family oxidoreductase [Turneriella sp.]|nr:TIGR01777 family oxidoreductase [Turneriella sp.]
MSKVLIAGATGFIGRYLIGYLLEKGDSIHALTRRKQNSEQSNISYFEWDVATGFIDGNAFDKVSSIINLTGANIGDQRWTNKRKTEILESRTKPIQLLYNYVREHSLKIDAFISSSAVGYYGAVTSDEVFIENSVKGADFLSEVCQKWEHAAFQFSALGARTVVLRKGVVIGKDGGIYQKLAPLAKRSLNTALGDGKQYLPWIDVRDVVRLYEFILTHREVSGVYNAVATEHITMNDFSEALLASFGKKSILPNVPKFMIQIAVGEMSVMLLKGSKVSNQKLRNTGFEFEYEKIKNALDL